MNLQRKIDSLARKESIWQKNLDQVYTARLITGISTTALIFWAAFYPGMKIELPLLLVSLLTFTFLIYRSRAYRRFLASLQYLKDFYLRQLSHQNGRFYDSPLEKEATRILKHDLVLDLVEHPHAMDLNLLKGHGLIHFIEECFSSSGFVALAKNLIEPPKDSAVRLKRRERTQRILKNYGFFRRLFVEGRKHALLSLHDLFTYARTPFLSKNFNTFYLGIWALYFVFLSGVFALSLNLSWAWILLVPYPIASLFLFQETTLGFQRALNLQSLCFDLDQILKPFRQTKRRELFADMLPFTLNKTFLKSIHEVHRIASCLSVQSHPLAVFIVNLVFPWNFYFVKKLEKVQGLIATNLVDVEIELSELEMTFSFATQAYYQSAIFPTETSEAVFEVDDIYHPLIDAKIRVPNTFHAQSTPVALITGSNMSGKSTFLRTLGINHILFLMGAPVFASRYKAYPYELLSCIRVSDSLEKGFSYFYAEVIRVKEIIERAKAHKCLVLIDEIFRGTNNRERYQGAKFILQELMESPSVSLVTTHDLELTKIETLKIRNFHFKEEVENDQFVFSYKLNTGPCPTTNAIRIMRHVGLDVPEVY